MSDDLRERIARALFIGNWGDDNGIEHEDTGWREWLDAADAAIAAGFVDVSAERAKLDTECEVQS